MLILPSTAIAVREFRPRVTRFRVRAPVEVTRQLVAAGAPEQQSHTAANDETFTAALRCALGQPTSPLTTPRSRPARLRLSRLHNQPASAGRDFLARAGHDHAKPSWWLHAQNFAGNLDYPMGSTQYAFHGGCQRRGFISIRTHPPPVCTLQSISGSSERVY